MASQNQITEIVEMLIKHGANIDILNKVSTKTMILISEEIYFIANFNFMYRYSFLYNMVNIIAFISVLLGREDSDGYLA